MNYNKLKKIWAIELTPIQKLVLQNLAQRENKDGECWPGIERIVKDTGASRKSVIAAIDYLEKAGLLETKKRWGKTPIYRTFPAASSVENDTTETVHSSVENDTHSSGEKGASISITELSSRIIKADIPSYRDSKKAAAVCYRDVDFSKIRQAADELIRTVPAFKSLQGNEQRIAELLIPTRRGNTQNANSLLNQAVDYATGNHSTQIEQHETNRRANGKMRAYLESIGATPDRLTSEAWREWNSAN